MPVTAHGSLATPQASIAFCTGTGERVCLSAEGFGNRQCFLESIVDKNVPPDLSQCVFVIEQALSVRALQEIISSNDAEAVSGKHIMI